MQCYRCRQSFPQSLMTEHRRTCLDPSEQEENAREEIKNDWDEWQSERQEGGSSTLACSKCGVELQQSQMDDHMFAHSLEQ
jgi:hypothetical protein